VDADLESEHRAEPEVSHLASPFAAGVRRTARRAAGYAPARLRGRLAPSIGPRGWTPARHGPGAAPLRRGKGRSTPDPATATAMAASRAGPPATDALGRSAGGHPATAAPWPPGGPAQPSRGSARSRPRSASPALQGQ